MIKRLLFCAMEARARIKIGDLVKIGKDSKLLHRKLQVKNGCTVKIGDKSSIEATILFDKSGSNVVVGSRTFIGDSRLVCAKSITIGDDVDQTW